MVSINAPTSTPAPLCPTVRKDVVQANELTASNRTSGRHISMQCKSSFENICYFWRIPNRIHPILWIREFRDEIRYKSSKSSVAITWLVSLDQIRRSDSIAAEVFSFLSCIEQSNISIDITFCGDWGANGTRHWFRYTPLVHFVCMLSWSNGAIARLTVCIGWFIEQPRVDWLSAAIEIRWMKQCHRGLEKFSLQRDIRIGLSGGLQKPTLIHLYVKD